VGNVVTYGAVLGYDPNLSNSIGYLRRGDAAAGSPAIAWSYVSSSYRVGINAVTQPQNALDVAGAVAIGFSYAGLSPMANSNGLSVQGSVGIGTFTPSTGANAQLTLFGTAAAGIELATGGATPGGGNIIGITGGGLSFSTFTGAVGSEVYTQRMVISSTGNVTVGGNLTVNGTNAATSTTTGALVVAGGIGVAGNVFSSNSWVSNYQYIGVTQGAAGSTATQVITSAAGGGTEWLGNVATSVNLNFVTTLPISTGNYGMTADRSNNIYANNGGGGIYKVSSSGVVTTLSTFPSGSQFMTSDGSNVYTSSGNLVSRISASGTVTAPWANLTTGAQVSDVACSS
jgi:hypothetical protein